MTRAALDSSPATISAGTCSSTAPPSAPPESKPSSKAKRCQCGSSRRRKAARRLQSSYSPQRGFVKGPPRSRRLILAAQSAREDAHDAQREKRSVLDQEEKLIFLD